MAGAFQFRGGAPSAWWRVAPFLSDEVTPRNRVILSAKTQEKGPGLLRVHPGLNFPCFDLGSDDERVRDLPEPGKGWVPWQGILTQSRLSRSLASAGTPHLEDT